MTQTTCLFNVYVQYLLIYLYLYIYLVYERLSGFSDARLKWQGFEYVPQTNK